MKSVILEAYGSVENFKMIETETPEVKGNEVLLEVHSVAVNAIDWKIRAGYLKEYMPYRFPIVMGWDISGVVKAVGELVTGFQAGDEVYARADISKPGGFAEYVVIADELLIKKPENLTFEAAAAFPLVAMTAWQMITDHAKLEKGEKVLIHGGAGGVGGFAIQFAKYLGATVATTTSGKNVEFVRGLGADIVIDYQKEDFAERKGEFDVVLDTLGGSVLDKSYDIVKKGGRLLSIAGQPSPELALEKNITAMYVVNVTDVGQIGRIGEMLSEGIVKVVIAERFPFTEDGVRKAHLLSESGHARGKAIVNVK